MLANHTSYLDPPLIGAVFERELTGLARDTLFKNPLFGALLRSINAFPIRRDGVDRRAIETCVSILKAGWPIVIYPEGTRSDGKQVQYPRGGFAMILDRMPGVPCVPLYLDGTGRALGRNMIFPRPVKVRASVGPAFTFEPRGEKESRRDFYARCSAQLAEEWRKLGANVADPPKEET